MRIKIVFESHLIPDYIGGFTDFKRLKLYSFQCKKLVDNEATDRLVQKGMNKKPGPKNNNGSY